MDKENAYSEVKYTGILFLLVFNFLTYFVALRMIPGPSLYAKQVFSPWAEFAPITQTFKKCSSLQQQGLEQRAPTAASLQQGGFAEDVTCSHVRWGSSEEELDNTVCAVDDTIGC